MLVLPFFDRRLPFYLERSYGFLWLNRLVQLSSHFLFGKKNLSLTLGEKTVSSVDLGAICFVSGAGHDHDDGNSAEISCTFLKFWKMHVLEKV